MKNHKSYLISVVLSIFCLVFHTPQAKAQPIYEGIETSSQLFNDNIWFFGAPNSSGGTWAECPSIAFVKDAGNNWVPQALPGGKRGKVASWENSLSVSTPSCDGNFIFYTMYNQVYNSRHEKMTGGNFDGNTSVADGLAACYVGNNKYFLFSCNTCYFSNISLVYYEIDMNQEGGLGSMIKKGVIESGMSESIELIPKKGTTDEYWLVYYHFQTGKMRVREVTPAGVSGTIVVQAVDPGPNLSTNISSGSNYSFMLKSNAAYNRLVLTIPITTVGFYVYDFDPATGQIRQNRFVSTATIPGYLYNADFSPNGKYIYHCSYTGNSLMYQYDLDNSTAVGSFQFTDHTSTVGGGLKRGPDGKMYVGRSLTKYVGAIDTPDLPVTNPDFKYRREALDVGIVYDNLPLSTGLTPPAKDPIVSLPPTANPDVGSTNQYMPITVDVIDNDSRGGGSVLTLTNAFFTDQAKTGQGEITVDDTNGTITFTPNPRYDYSGANGTVSISYVAQNNSTPIAMCGSGTLTITVTPTYVSSTLFSDDVWFFGQNTGASEGSGVMGNAKTSKGIIFRNKSGVMVPEDASGISSVNSWENSLSISTPACDGSFIFYVQHDMIYNSNHSNMKNGSISGHTSTGDGLAAAYLGDNKYFLASVSTVNQGNLQYSIVDMGAENGLGEKVSTTTIDNSGTVNEAIEMVPMVDTYNKYWLIYCLKGSSYTVVVKKVDGTDPSAPVITEAGRITIPAAMLANQNVWRMHSSPDYSIIAMNAGGSTGAFYNHYFLNFNPQTGAISFNRALDTRGASHSSYSSYVFYGNYLYLSESQSGADAYYIYQYDISGTTWSKVATFKVTNTPASIGSQSWQGGGMKMGPDGKIYFIRQSSYYSGVIKDPGKLLTIAGNVDENGFKHKYNGMGLTFSTGLTPPWINPPSSNREPNATNDAAATTNVGSVVIKPLENDVDPDGHALNLVGVEFAVAADAAKGTVTFDAGTKEVTFTPNSSYPFTDNEKVNIIYTVRDNGLPVAVCAKGNIEVAVRLAKLSVNLSGAEVGEGNEVSITICMPDETKAPLGGLTFTLNRIAGTTEVSDYEIVGNAKIAEGQQCATLKIKAAVDNLLEIDDETLILNATAAGFTALDQASLIIKDRTDGTIVVEPASPASRNMAEPSTGGSFKVKFKDPNVTTAKIITVTFSLTGADSGTDYEPVLPLKVEIGIGAKEATVPITVHNNYIVQGNRALRIQLESAVKKP